MKILPKFICSMTFCFSLNLSAAHFTIQDLGTLSTEQSLASGINENNCIAGKVTNEGVHSDFIWDEANGLTLLDHKTTFHVPLINNQGVLAGIFYYKTEFWFSGNKTSKHIYLRYPDGSFKDIDFPSNWKNTLFIYDWQTFSLYEKEIGIIGFNDKEQLLLCNSSDRAKATEYAIWEKGKFNYFDKETLDKAYAINNQGIILGRKWINENGKAIPMLVLFDRDNNSYIEIMRDVNIGSQLLNDLSEVAVIQGVKVDNFKGYYWSAEKGLMALDFLPLAINNRNQMTGLKLFENEAVPVFWEQGNFINLCEDLKIGESETLWTNIKQISGINDKGRIVGRGEFEGNTHSFMLIPNNK